jgi:hypothetical protein
MSFLYVCQGILVPAVQPSFQLSDFPLQIAPATHTSLELTSFSRSALTQVHSKDMSLAREILSDTSSFIRHGWSASEYCHKSKSASQSLQLQCFPREVRHTQHLIGFLGLVDARSELDFSFMLHHQIFLRSLARY